MRTAEARCFRVGRAELLKQVMQRRTKLMVFVLVVLLAGISVTIPGCKLPWEEDDGGSSVTGPTNPPTPVPTPTPQPNRRLVKYLVTNEALVFNSTVSSCGTYCEKRRFRVVGAGSGGGDIQVDAMSDECFGNARESIYLDPDVRIRNSSGTIVRSSVSSTQYIETFTFTPNATAVNETWEIEVYLARKPQNSTTYCSGWLEIWQSVWE